VRLEDNGIGETKAAALKINNPVHKNSSGRRAKAIIPDLNEGMKVVVWMPVTH
jgi:hypothetical protein